MDRGLYGIILMLLSVSMLSSSLAIANGAGANIAEGLMALTPKLGSINAVQLYQEHSFDSDWTNRALSELKSTIPDCGYVELTAWVDTNEARAVARTSYSGELDSAIAKARAMGYKIALRIHTSNGQIGFVPINTTVWFASFADAVQYWANYAQGKSVELFCMATEFTQLELPQYAFGWNEVISHVRAVYSGTLTYDTNWWFDVTSQYGSLDQKLALSWLSRLDCIGISAYWEVATQNLPSVDMLIAGWHSYPQHTQAYGDDISVDIKKLSDYFHKPILFYTGLASVEGACRQPWKSDWGSVDNSSQLEQQNWYDAIFKVFGNYSFTAGYICDGAWPNHAITDEDPNGKTFSIQNKKATAVVEYWFSVERPHADSPFQLAELLILSQVWSSKSVKLDWAPIGTFMLLITLLAIVMLGTIVFFFVATMRRTSRPRIHS